jgi:hypothetical protein
MTRAVMLMLSMVLGLGCSSSTCILPGSDGGCPQPTDTCAMAIQGGVCNTYGERCGCCVGSSTCNLLTCSANLEDAGVFWVASVGPSPQLCR